MSIGKGWKKLPSKIIIILYGQTKLQIQMLLNRLFQGDTEDDVSGRVPKIGGADVQFITQVQV